MLNFQKLDVYQRAIQFLAFASALVEELPRGNAERADQLIRAAESVLRNIAEGAGRWSKADVSKHCIELLEAVVAMLTKMITVESPT
jgi:hypothetical protein